MATATAAHGKALGAPYQAGDQIGQGGIEQVYQARLAGRPSLTIRIEGPGDRADATAARFAAAPGQPVTTSIDMRYQLAVSQAVRSAKTTKPIDMVVIQPSTGKLVTIPAPRPQAQPHAISPAILDTLRPMMRPVVTTGTGGLGADSAGPIGNAFLRNL